MSNKYLRNIKGVEIDVYDVLKGFDVTCPAMAHAIKKMLCSGNRGYKDSEQDKREAIASIERSIELNAEQGERQSFYFTHDREVTLHLEPGWKILNKGELEK